jgi:hypothetical protein
LTARTCAVIGTQASAQGNRAVSLAPSRHLWFADELPKGGSGKVLKREIRVPADVSRAAEHSDMH